MKTLKSDRLMQARKFCTNLKSVPNKQWDLILAC